MWTGFFWRICVLTVPRLFLGLQCYPWQFFHYPQQRKAEASVLKSCPFLHSVYQSTSCCTLLWKSKFTMLTSPCPTTYYQAVGNPWRFCFKRSRIGRPTKSLLGLYAPVSWMNLNLLLHKNILWYLAFCYYIWTTCGEMILCLLIISLYLL